MIAVTANFTAEPLAEPLAFWLRELGLDGDIRFAPYNQVLQQLLDPASLLATNTAGANVLLIRVEDWRRFSPDADLDRQTSELVQAVENFTTRAFAPLIICLCPSAPDFAETERSLAAAFAEMAGVHLATTELYPVADPLDAHGDQAGHIPYTPEYFAALATALARKIRALLSPPRKVIALDCDQTLWRGICGEDGPLGIEIDPPRRALQEFIIAQREAGMLLCLCTKNAPGDVDAVFAQRDDMPLRRDHITAARIGWGAKSESLRALAAELRLGLDSFIFIDDNALECAEVRAHCPGVLVLELPAEPERIPHFLRHVWAFDRARITDEDRRRAQLYSQQRASEQLREAAGSFEEFLAGLELEVRIAEPTAAQFPRLAQLTERTNQFNTTTIRRTEPQLRALTGECRVVEVRDRFGDYGLVGAMFFHAKNDALVVESLLLSCRVLGKGVEHRMLAHLGREALERGLEKVRVDFQPTPRNEPARLFLESIGGSPLPATEAATLQPRAVAAPPAPAASVAPPDDDSLQLARIARELTTPGEILAALRARKRQRPSLRQPAEPPRTPLERSLADLWEEVLLVEGIGIHDNFADLGGGSLHVAQVHSRLAGLLRRAVPITHLFDSPTIHTLSRRLSEPETGLAAVAARAARQRAALARAVLRRASA